MSSRVLGREVVEFYRGDEDVDVDVNRAYQLREPLP